MKIARNDNESLQVEWKGCLLTLRLNPHHGLFGSLAVHEKGKIRLLQFHGQGGDAPFPMVVHEGELDRAAMAKK